MNTEYLQFVLDGLNPMLDDVSDPVSLRLMLAGTMSRFLNCDSLNDLSDTYGIRRKSLYDAFDNITPSQLLKQLRKRGRKRFLAQLQKWHRMDPSYRSRHAITLAADDFTETVRGGLGEWKGLFYSGAEGKVVTGINIEALVAVIGDGDEVIVLDVRIVPPRDETSGEKLLSRNEWLRKALNNLNSFLRMHGATVRGCSLSVDAAYVSHENVQKALDLGIDLVGKLPVNRRVEGNIWMNFSINASARIFSEIGMRLNPGRCRILRGETSVEYLRNYVEVPAWGAKVLVVTFIQGNELRLNFSTNLNMKVVTLRNIIRYRWQLERVFWILKQDIGIGDIHHHKEDRVETRIYLHFMLAQVTRDVAKRFQISPKMVIRKIRRSPHLVMLKLGFQSAFVPENSWETSSFLANAA